MEKTIKEKVEFITNIVKELGDILLTSKCGKYYAVVKSGESVVALKFVGMSGYSSSSIGKLKPKTIDLIYEDLYEDFG